MAPLVVLPRDASSGEIGPSSSASPELSSSTTSSRKSKVSFRGVAIREYGRILGDNPSAENGAPLGLDWYYRDVRRDSSETATDNDNSENDGDDSDNDSTIIPMDDYEQESERRRRIRLNEILRLQEKSKKQQKAQLRTVQRRASTQNNFFKDDTNPDGSAREPKPDELSEEQIKQLSARWLKIQPVHWKTRERILMREANTSKAEIERVNKDMRKLKQQRQTTIAMAETGLDQWQNMAQLVKRRFRRLKSGISKDKEQALLWEMATKYWDSDAEPSTSSEKTEEQKAA